MLKDEKDIMLEKWLDEALKSSPGYTLPVEFAEKVAARVSSGFAWRQYFREFLVYLGVIAGIAAVSVVMSLVWLDTSWQEWQMFLENNLTWIACLNVVGLFVLFADRVLLRYFFIRFSGESLN